MGTGTEDEAQEGDFVSAPKEEEGEDEVVIELRPQREERERRASKNVFLFCLPFVSLALTD